MSPQIIELLIFAAIAFFIINKLISILGTSDDIDPRAKSSRFGEPGNLKDVTSTGADWSIRGKLDNAKNIKEPIEVFLLADPNNHELITKLEEITEHVEKFNLTNFVKNASKAWQMIIKAVSGSSKEMVNALVDKRYIEEIMEKADLYKTINVNKLPDSKVSDVTFFGNSIMIKVLFTTDNMPTEEWTYTRNLNQSGPNWFLSNIDQYIS